MSTLCDLAVANSGVIAEISADGVYRERLHGMGLIPGRRVSVIRSGVPMIVDVCGGRIALDRELAARVRLNDVTEPTINGQRQIATT